MTDRDVTRVSRINYSPAISLSRVRYIVQRSHRWERIVPSRARISSGKRRTRARKKNATEGEEKREYLYTVRYISLSVRVSIRFNLRRASKPSRWLWAADSKWMVFMGSDDGYPEERTGPGQPGESGPAMLSGPVGGICRYVYNAIGLPRLL